MSQEERNEGLSLLEIYNVLRRYKTLLLLLPLSGAVLAVLLVSFVLRPTWEASATVEVGRIGQVVQAGGGSGGVWQASQLSIEPAVNAMARLVLPSFAKEAIKYAGIKPEETNAMLPYYDTLKVSKIKDAELIEIKLRGPSSEMANNLMQGLIINLQKAHSKMMFDSVEKNAKQLQVLVADIQKSGVEMDVLRQRLLSSHNWSDFDASIAATLLQNKAYEVREMTQRKLMLDEQLSSTRTFTARVVDEVYVSDGPVSPRKALIIGLAILLGLVCAVVFAFGHNAIAAKSA